MARPATLTPSQRDSERIAATAHCGCRGCRHSYSRNRTSSISLSWIQHRTDFDGIKGLPVREKSRTGKGGGFQVGLLSTHSPSLFGPVAAAARFWLAFSARSCSIFAVNSCCNCLLNSPLARVAFRYGDGPPSPRQFPGAGQDEPGLPH